MSFLAGTLNALTFVVVNRIRPSGVAATSAFIEIGTGTPLCSVAFIFSCPSSISVVMSLNGACS